MSTSGSGTVLLHPLAIRQEGEEWIVGRVETGVFVALPEIGVQVIDLLARGRTVPEVAAELGGDQSLDVTGFVASLEQLGFLHDGTPEQATRTSSLPWVRTEHVRWLLHPAVTVATLAMLAAAVVIAVVAPIEIPGAEAAVWSPWSSLVLLSQIVTAWSVIFLHELAHLFTARAAGVPGKMSISTRLQFLVAQTDVSGIWSAPRRIRMTVYLSGMAVNGLLALVALVLYNATPPGGLHNAAAVLFVLQPIMLATQFMFFMRTDVYFVVQDLARCRNLYGDASAYLRHLLRRATRRNPGQDPSRTLPPRERRAVLSYVLFLVPSTLICLASFLFVSFPITVRMVGQTYGNLTDAGSAADLADALLIITAVVFFQSVWFRAWWRRHGERVRALLRRLDSGARSREAARPPGTLPP
ncbi:hypothetical protein E1295_00220 [Nonomuraea mesophila]|uniref:PqqD family protein n=1 Tax=Nonomuraea mesophila TaxID=2530382 RepID=A0A4R5FZ19_9ACTN|nr:hypothetical protein [Nonomuraea mesophila]TDE60308.1 hypothetical protein E1295_00220 [Nonomuraea mesophila]